MQKLILQTNIRHASINFMKAIGIYLRILVSFIFIILYSRCGSAGTPQQNIEGIYEGSHQREALEFWVQGKSNVSHSNKNPLEVIVVFKKEKAIVLEKFQKYSNLESFYQDFCIENKKDENQIYRYPFHLMNKIAFGNSVALSVLDPTPDNPSTPNKYRLSPLSYIDFKGNDEHGLIRLSFDSSGNLSKAHFLETGFAKKIWNYILIGPQIRLTKSSQDPTDVFRIVSDFQNTFKTLNKQLTAKLQAHEELCP